MGAGYSLRAAAGEADLYLYEDVGESWFGGVSAKQVADDLKAIGKVSVINLHVNSMGGDVFEGMAIYRQLVDNSARVVTHIDGLAASIASVIACAGDEIRITQAGFVMIHEAMSMVYGYAADLRRQADLLDTVSGAICDVYVARTQAAETDLRAWMTAETWFTAQEAVEKGFADQVVENLRVAARCDVSKHRYLHVPAELSAFASPEVVPFKPAAALPAPAPVPVVITPARQALKAKFDLQRAQHATKSQSAPQTGAN